MNQYLDNSIHVRKYQLVLISCLQSAILYWVNNEHMWFLPTHFFYVHACTWTVILQAKIDTEQVRHRMIMTRIRFHIVCIQHQNALICTIDNTSPLYHTLDTVACLVFELLFNTIIYYCHHIHVNFCAIFVITHV